MFPHTSLSGMRFIVEFSSEEQIIMIDEALNLVYGIDRCEDYSLLPTNTTL